MNAEKKYRVIVGEKKKTDKEEKVSEKIAPDQHQKWGTISKYKNEGKKLWPLYSLRHCVHDSYKFFCWLLPPYRPSQLKPESLEGKRRVGGGEEEEKIIFFYCFCICGFQSKFGR